MTPEAADPRPDASFVQVKLLGQFSLSVGANRAGPWPRPPAKRLCELVLLSPGRTISRDRACEVLFPHLGRNGAPALSKALSMARATLSRLGEPAASLLQADLVNIWASPDVTVSVDAECQEAALRAALDMGPGQRRDDSLVASLSELGPSLPTSRPPTGHYGPENGWMRSGKRLAWPWPETGAVASGAQTS